MSKEPRKQKPYTYYRFSNYDPVIQKTIAMIDDKIGGDGRANSAKTYRAFAEDAGISTTTLYNWRRRKTRRPSFSTIAACWAAAGRKTIDIS